MSIAAALAVAILVAYAASLWWLLREERWGTLLLLAGLAAVCLALRLVYPKDYPAGTNEDEVKILWCTIDYLRRGLLFAEDCTGLPALPSILFEAQLAEIIGPSQWSMRAYSTLGSVLAVPAAFAAARSLGLRRGPSLAAAGFLAVLPWSIFYGRVHQSGNMVFNELLVVASLARFVRGSGGLPELGMSALSLCLLFYGYFCGRVLVGFAVVAAVLARGRHRALCLAIPLIALVGYYPYTRLSLSPHAWVGFTSQQTQEEYVEDPLATLVTKTTQALKAFVAPVAFDQWLTICTGAMHPLLILGLALLGSFTGGPRRSLFLWAGFIGGLAPTIIGHSPLPSTRRMLMAYPFISLAAACALDVVPWRRWRVGLCALVLAIVGVQSVRFYFSPAFWPPWSLWIFDGERSPLVDAIPMPPHPRLIISSGMGFYFAPRARYDTHYEVLSAQNWFPPEGGDTLYVFSQQFAPLQPLYASVPGIELQRFGRASLVRVPPGDWSTLRRHGWRYDWHCGGETRTGQIPTVYIFEFSFPDTSCTETAQHTWRGRWAGPTTRLRFRFHGKAVVEAQDGVRYRGEGWEQTGEFQAARGDDLTIRLDVPYGLETLAALVEADPRVEQVPLLQSVEMPD